MSSCRSFSSSATELLITGLGWNEVRTNGSVVRIDDPADGLATITLGSGELAQLWINGAATSDDHLELDETGNVSLSAGMSENSVVSVNGVPIGRISLNEYGFRVYFNEGTTAAQAQELLRAITYQNVSTAPVVVEPREIDIRLFDDAGGFTRIYTAVVTAPSEATILNYNYDNLTGSGGNDIFVANDGTKLWGDDLNGGDGEDTLYLGGGHGFDLTELSSFTSIEIVSGTSQGENVRIGQEQFEGIMKIDGGPNSALAYDTLALYGDEFDFAGKEILNFDVIGLAKENGVVTVYDAATALLMGAEWGVRGTHLKLLGGATLTPDEIAFLHDAGIDRVTVGNNPSSTDAAPVASGLDGERVGVTAGQTVRLDQGPAFQVEDGDEVLGSLIVEVQPSATSYHQLGIAQTSDVSIVEDYWVYVNGTLIGSLISLDDGYLEIDFDGTATADRVEKVVEALTYKNTAPDGAFGDVSVHIRVLDKGTRSATSTVTVYNADPSAQNHAPADVRLSGQTSVSTPENAAFAAVLSATDQDEDALTFSFDASAAGGGNAGGMFVIDNATRQLKLAPGKILDFETAQSFTVFVKASDGRGGVSAAQALTITVIDVAEQPAGKVLVGTSRADKLVGGDGNDKLSGKLSRDVLTGGQGKDVFVFDTKPDKKTNLDTIKDFTVADDTIWLDNKVFKKLGKGTEAAPGALKKAFFRIADKAKDKNDYLVYNKQKGILYYDADGSGSGKAVEIAKLAKNLRLTEKDFFVI